MSRDYKSGKIYCIRNNITDDVYVGSSCEKYLSKRWVKHKSSMNNERDKATPLYQKMNELGVESFYIELLENYPCENSDQLRAREGHYIREMATLNKRVETRTKKEYKEDNKDYFKEYDKRYYQDHKEDHNQKSKQWYENNKDKAKEQRKERYENNKETVLEQNKKWRDEHKEEQKDYFKKHREENKDKIKARASEVIECECGFTYTRQHKSRHYKTQRHQAYLHQQNEN